MKVSSRIAWLLSFAVVMVLLGTPCVLLWRQSWVTLACFVLLAASIQIWASMQRSVSCYCPPGCPPACFHERGGHRLFVSHSGSGQCTALLLHGMLASHRFFNTTTELLCARGVQCVAPDLLGFGRSPWPKGAQYDVSTHCSWLRRDAVPPGTEPLHIIGHSLGGILALQLAASLPSVASVTVVSMPYYKHRKIAYEHLRHQWIPYFLVWCPMGAWLLCSIVCQQRWLWRTPLTWLLMGLNKVLPPGLRVPPEVVEDFFLHSCESASSTMTQCILEHNLLQALSTLTSRGVLLHVVHGDCDDVVPLHMAQAFASEHGASLHVVPGAHHMLPLHAADALDHILATVMLPVGAAVN